LRGALERILSRKGDCQDKAGQNDQADE